MGFISTLACRGASTWNPLREGGTANRTNPCPPPPCPCGSLCFLESIDLQIQFGALHSSVISEYPQTFYISFQSPVPVPNVIQVILSGANSPRRTRRLHSDSCSRCCHDFLISRLRFLLRNKLELESFFDPNSVPSGTAVSYATAASINWSSILSLSACWNDV